MLPRWLLLREGKLRSKMSPQQFDQLCKRHRYRCYYCGVREPLTRDHREPLSRGGADDETNIVPACEWCNQKKKDLTEKEFKCLPHLQARCKPLPPT